MSLEAVINALEHLGLTRQESEVYVYTAKNGPQTFQILAEALKYSPKQINTSLKTLIEKALIIKKGTNLHAISFEEALELLIEREKQKAKFVQNIKKEIFDWASKNITDS